MGPEHRQLYHAIEPDGRPKVGQVVEGGDVIIAKFLELKEKEDDFQFKDVSTTIRSNEHGIIDKNYPQ